MARKILRFASAAATLLPCLSFAGPIRAQEIVTPPAQHLRLGFRTSFPINAVRNDSVTCVDYNFSVVNGTARLAVDMGADVAFSYDRKDLLPGGSVPIQVTYTPTNDDGPELSVDATGDVMMGVNVDDVCLVAVIAACAASLGLDVFSCSLAALGAALDSFSGELDHFDLISASGDFTAPLGAVPPVSVPGTGGSATLQFLGTALARATPVSNITLAPTPTGGLPGLGGAVALLGVSGATLTSPSPIIPVLEWQSPTALTATIALPATPGPNATLTLSPMLHWLNTSASIELDIDLLGVLGAVFSNPSNISIFSGNLGTGLGLDSLICDGVPAAAQAACLATVAAGNVPYPALLPQSPDLLPTVPPLAPFASAQISIDPDADDDGLFDGEEIALGTNPDDADTDDDQLGDGLEVTSGTDPLDADTDNDGVPDGDDVEWLQHAINALPNTAFRDLGRDPGLRNSVISKLDSIEALVAKGDTTKAIAQVELLRGRVDGCASTAGTADKDDWIVNCAAQIQIRDLLNLYITNLST
jgi:hypothetical protein